MLPSISSYTFTPDFTAKLGDVPALGRTHVLLCKTRPDFGRATVYMYWSIHEYEADPRLVTAMTMALLALVPTHFALQGC